MARQPPPLTRKTSTPWERLRPVRQDPLESMGFVSKGDDRLLDPRAQEAFYHKIVARYMRFCTQHARDLDTAFASLTIRDDRNMISQNEGQLPLQPKTTVPGHPSQTSASTGGIVAFSTAPLVHGPLPEDELSHILIALRKLREGLLASSGTLQSLAFSQRVHIFNVRLAILALHPASYHPSLNHLLSRLHTKSYPLPKSELVEMTTYLILDLALRRNELVAAYAVRHRSKRDFGYTNREVDGILRAVTTNNWVSFWRIRRKVDGHIRAIMHWYIDAMCKTTLKAFGRSYMQSDITWLLQSATGSEMSWEELVEREKVGWLRDGNMVVIRKPKTK